MVDEGGVGLGLGSGLGRAALFLGPSLASASINLLFEPSITYCESSACPSSPGGPRRCSGGSALGLFDRGSSGKTVDCTTGTRGICGNKDILSKLMSNAVSVGLTSLSGILWGGDALMFGKFPSISIGIDSNIRHLGSTGM